MNKIIGRLSKAWSILTKGAGEATSAATSLPGMGWYYKQIELEAGRIQNYKFYEEMDNESSIIGSALDIYADNALQITSEEEGFRFRVEEVDGKQESKRVEAAEEVIKELATRLKFTTTLWALTRSVAKFGDSFKEIVASDTRIVKLKTLPPTSMYIQKDDFGALKTDPYVQKENDSIIVKFKLGQILHTKMTSDDSDYYGKSILKKARKIYKQISMIEDGLIIARLTRAYNRLVHLVDVTGLPATEVFGYLDKYRKRNAKKRIVDPVSGKVVTEENPLTEDEDLFLPVREGSKADVKPIQGSVNIGQLADINYFNNKLFAAIKTPKAYLGFEKEVGAKATITMLDVQFARSVRRLQLVVADSVRMLAELELVLQDFGRCKVVVIPPPLRTVDEHNQWLNKEIQYRIAQSAYTSQLLPLDIIYKDILNFDEDVINKILKNDDKKSKEYFKPNPKVMRELSRNKEFQEMVESLKDLVDIELSKREFKEAKKF